MKKLFKRPAGAPPVDLDVGPGGEGDAGFFAAQTPEADDDELALATWSQRAVAIRAEMLDRTEGAALFSRLWGEDRHFARLSAQDLERMSRYLQFVQVGPGKEVIEQNELGDFLLILLEGAIAVERRQRETRVRIGQAHAGDMLGEMSLLDAGARFSSCTTQGKVRLAVLEARQLDAMMDQDPPLALALLASLSRRLSLRLRQTSARLSALLAR